METNFGTKIANFLLGHANWFAPGFFVIALLVLMAATIAPSERASLVVKQYDAYWDAMHSDIKALEMLNQYFVYAPPYSNFTERAKVATAYARKAKDAIATWQSFKAFITANKATLDARGINHERFLEKMEEGKTEIKAASDAIATDLNALAGKNKAKQGEAEEPLRLLEQLS